MGYRRVVGNGLPARGQGEVQSSVDALVVGSDFAAQGCLAVVSGWQGFLTVLELGDANLVPAALNPGNIRFHAKLFRDRERCHALGVANAAGLAHILPLEGAQVTLVPEPFLGVRRASHDRPASSIPQESLANSGCAGLPHQP